MDKRDPRAYLVSRVAMYKVKRRGDMVARSDLRLANYSIRIAQLVWLFSILNIVWLFSILHLPIDNPDQMAGSIYRQLIYASLFVGSAALLLRNIGFGLSKVISIAPWLWVFILYAIVSVAWSEYPIVSAKRVLQLVGAGIIGLALVFPGVHASPLTRSLRPVLTVALVLSIVIVLALPGYGIDSSGAWKGVTVHKNTFGSVAAISFIMWAVTVKNQQGINFWSLGFCGLSIAAVIASQSATSLAIALTASSVLLLWFVHQHSGLSWLAIISFAVTISAAAMQVIVAVYGYPSLQEILNLLTGTVGRDATLTGRTELWELLWNEVVTHFWFGAGYDSFWVGEVIVTDSGWAPGQGHNGYLDILNELGAVGFGIMFVLLFSHTMNLRRLYVVNQELAELHILIFLTTLAKNIAESSLFRSVDSLPSVILIFSIIEVSYLLQTVQARSVLQPQIIPKLPR